ncbi:MAG TPA: rhomboid family intramembrane serine protease [Bacteroidota bacterium]|nr:rhomboid family intramembrane serine protease [Bacteroidota bacterium]
MAYNRNQYGNYYRPNFFGGFSFFPPVIKALLISNTGVWLLILFLGNFRVGDYSLSLLITEWCALMPLGQGFEIWQLFTYLFMHGGFTHLFFNMFALWMFGMELENTWGSRKFLTYYLICGVGAGLSNILIAPLFTTIGPTIGASGAIYGVLLAYGLLFPDRLIFIYFFVPLKAKYFVILYMIIEFVSVGSTDGIAHFAHLGGAVVGLIYLLADGFRFSLPQRTQRTPTNIFGNWNAPRRSNSNYENVSEAQVYDIKEYQRKEEAQVTQQRIDEILDKISKAGYQSLSDDEKKMLFEASKKLN